MESRGVYGVKVSGNIRPECLIPLPGPWARPTGAEIAAAISMAGLNGTSFSRMVGVYGRTVRRWLSDDAPMPYAAWAWLAARAGLAELWRPAMPHAGEGGKYSFELEEIEGANGWRLRLFERDQELATKDFLPADEGDRGAYARALAEGTAWLDTEAGAKQ